MATHPSTSASQNDPGSDAPLPRTPSNPFTRNQDAAKLARRLRRASLQSQQDGNKFFPQEDGSDDSDSDVFRIPSSHPPDSQEGWYSPFSRSSRQSFVFGERPHSRDDQTLTLSEDRSVHGETEPPLRPRLRPAGSEMTNKPVPGQLADPNTVYGDSSGKSWRRVSLPNQSALQPQRIGSMSRALTQQRQTPGRNDDALIRTRRLSHDAVASGSRRFIVNVAETIQLLLNQEDSDGNYQISITDVGPKVMNLGTEDSEGYNTFEIRGTYMLSTLLQELALAQDHGRTRIILDEARLTENPVDRLSRMISQSFWHNLTRRIDGVSLQAILSDPKNWSKSRANRIYVPAADQKQVEYYRQLAKEKPELELSVEELPHMDQVTPEVVRDYSEAPGLLALDMEEVEDPTRPGETTLRGKPFVVPGARFNELYNWDSYFISLGLVVDNYIDLAKSITDNFIYEIKHYQKILNGNRTYYLLRSQPPFLTDLALQVYCRLNPEEQEANNAWLKKAIQAAIKEYHTIWMNQPRYDPKTGLSRYHPEGLGVPPETEATHFTHILRPYADRWGISINE